MSVEYRYNTSDLAALVGMERKAVRRRAAELRIGINRGGRAGYRYSEADVAKFLDSMKPEAPAPRRRRRAA